MPAPDKTVLFAELERHVNSIDSAVTSFFSGNKSSSCHPAPTHQHARAELLLCSKGLINCQVERCLWVIPENTALWIPAGLKHRGFGGYAEYYAVYVDSEQALRLPDQPFVIQTSLLLRELIMKSVSFNQCYEKESVESRFFSVILDELAVAERRDLIVPMPADPRLRLMVEQLILNPSDKTTHSEWAVRLCLSQRSFSRIVRRNLA